MREDPAAPLAYLCIQSINRLQRFCLSSEVHSTCSNEPPSVSGPSTLTAIAVFILSVLASRSPPNTEPLQDTTAERGMFPWSILSDRKKLLNPSLASQTRASDAAKDSSLITMPYSVTDTSNGTSGKERESSLWRLTQSVCLYMDIYLNGLLSVMSMWVCLALTTLKP